MDAACTGSWSGVVERTGISAPFGGVGDANGGETERRESRDRPLGIDGPMLGSGLGERMCAVSCFGRDTSGGGVPGDGSTKWQPFSGFSAEIMFPMPTGDLRIGGKGG